MGFIIGLLTLFMVLDCVVLVLLVLLQLPKKEAGAGLAFGGAASDALFGAGSGNVLTKITKWAATIFFVLAVVLSILQNNYYHRGGSNKFLQGLSAPAQPMPGESLPPTAPATRPAAAPTATNALKSVPQAEATNLPALPAAPPATPTAPNNTTTPK